MKCIPPMTVTPAILTTPPAAEPWAPAAYAGGTAYAAGDIAAVAADYAIYESLAAGNLGNTPNVSPTWWRVIATTEDAYNGATTYPLGATASSAHRIYQSLQAGNVGHSPLTSPSWWLDVGATNRWRAFDLLRNTQTIVASPLVAVITPGLRIDAIALLGMVADTYRVQVSSVLGGGVVYDSGVQSLSSRLVQGWYDYFFAAFTTKPSTALFDLPPYSDCVITVTLTRVSGNVYLGSLVVGSQVYVGIVEYEPVSDVLNFSTITRDTFGNSVLVPRRNVPKTTQQVWTRVGAVDGLLRLRDALNAEPAVWSGLDDQTQGFFGALLILGIYKVFRPVLKKGNWTLFDLELEEV